jgi:hypothetical protein
MRVRTEVLLVLVLAMVVGIGVMMAVFGARVPGQEQDTRTSTLVATPEGSQAVYETLAELGVPVRRRRSAFFTLEDERTPIAALAVIAPRGELLSDELVEVVRYVRRGGTVVAAGEAGGITACVGLAAPRADSGWVSDGFFGGVGRPVAVRASGWDLPPVRRVLKPWEPPKEFGSLVERFFHNAGCRDLEPAAADTLLETLDGRAVIVRLRYAGHGRVLVVAEPGLFRNRAWRDTDAAHYLAPLLVPAGRGALVWDEYHHGFDEDSGATAALWEWVKRTPVGWALLQIGAVVLVWLAVKAVRFGPALAVVERRRRSPLEHVEALAAGLEGARGSATAVDAIIGGLRRRLSRAGHAPSSDPGAWLDGLELVLPSDRGRAAARTLRELWRGTGGDERVLEAAQAVEDVWQDLRPRSSPAAS